MTPMKIRMVAMSLVVLLAAGCASHAVKKVHRATPFPARVALLPLESHVVSMQGPVLVRKLLEMRLVGGGYNPPLANEVDEKLRAIGITDGGQLRSVSATRLCETLGVDAVLMGDLLEFKYTNIGVYAKRAVKAQLRLVAAGTGEVLWQGMREDSSSKLGLSSEGIRDNLVGGLAVKLVETALKNPLRPESETVCAALMRDLNRFRKDW